MGFFQKKKELFDVLYREPREPSVTSIVPAQPAQPSAITSAGYHNGDKWRGGFGNTNLLIPDYWVLRARSAQLFKQNLYARGIIRRMVTNEINVGLHLESTPKEKRLGLEQDALADWSEAVEDRFEIWADNPRLCDHAEQNTFGELQAVVRREALVVGDVLVVLKQDQRTKLPRIQLINGGSVQTPLDRMLTPKGGNRVSHGVELDQNGRHVAYWVRQPDGKSKRLAAYGEKSGRRLAWLVYGTDKRMDEVRGEPLLALVLQSIKEIDRYRDSVQLKATINAMLAMVVEKETAAPGSRPLAAGGISRRLETTLDTEGEERSYNLSDYTPGVVIDELNVGEKIRGFQSHGTDEKFGDFEAAIIQAIAWGLEIPPEILRLSFNSNYSASQAAINEYKLYLNPVRTAFGKSLCTYVYQDWLLSEVLDGRIDAASLLKAWRSPKQYDVFGAWVSCDWAGNIKPAVDPSKLVKAYDQMVASGYLTRDRAARELTGTKYSKNVQRLRIENEQLAEANRPLVELEALKSAPGPGDGEGSQNGPGRPRKQDSEEDPDDIDRVDDDDERAMIRVVAGA